MKLLKIREIATLMGISYEKTQGIVDYDRTFPIHKTESLKQFGFISRKWAEQDVLDWIDKNQNYKTQNARKSTLDNYFKILSKFVDRTIPIHSLKSTKTQNQYDRIRIKLSERDVDNLKRYDPNYDRTMK